MKATYTTFLRPFSGITLPAAADHVMHNGQFYRAVISIAGGAIALNQWSVSLAMTGSCYTGALNPTT